jgi:hypothetical protein
MADRGRISDMEAFSIRRILRLRFHTNMKRPGLLTNMGCRLHTTMKRRRDRRQAYPVLITTPDTPNNDP